MSTALATRPSVVLQPIDDAFVKVIQWVALSGYFKEAKDEAQAAVKMLIGRELGLQPMASMMGIDIIDTQRGPRPRLSSNVMAGLIKASGEYDYFAETSATAAKVTVLRNPPEGGREIIGSVSYTIEEARRAGIARAGSPWEKFTPDMLFARAMSRTKRLVPHLFLGLSGNVDVVLPEELDDEPMSDDQRKAIFAQLNDLGITDRGQRLAWASDVLGREVATFTALSRTEAGALLEWLASDTKGPTSDTPSGQNADQAGGVDESIVTGADLGLVSVDPGRGAEGPIDNPSVPVHPRGDGDPAKAGTIPRQPAGTTTGTSGTVHYRWPPAGSSEAVGEDWQRADPASHPGTLTAEGSLADGATVVSSDDDDRHTELVFRIAAAHSEWAKTMPKAAGAWFNGFLAHVKRPNLNECDVEELEAGWDWLVALNRAK